MSRTERMGCIVTLACDACGSPHVERDQILCDACRRPTLCHAPLVASPIVGAITVLSHGRCDGDFLAEVACPDYDAFRALPAAILFLGRTLGRTGWNSDTGRACYKESARFALPMTGRTK